jgi:hypothetical protein
MAAILAAGLLAPYDEMRVLEVEHLVRLAVEGGLDEARAEQMRAILADDLATRRAVLAMRRGQEIDIDEMVERGREAGRIRDRRLTGLLGDDGFAALDWDAARVRADQEYMSRPIREPLWNGAELAELCSKGDEDEDEDVAPADALCRTYISAVADSRLRPDPPATGPGDLPAFCIPVGVMTARPDPSLVIAGRVISYLHDLAYEEEGESAFVVVARALSQAYPCDQATRERLSEHEHLVRIAVEAGLDAELAAEMRVILAEFDASENETLDLSAREEIPFEEIAPRAREARRIRDARLKELLGEDEFAALEWDEASYRAHAEAIAQAATEPLVTGAELADDCQGPSYPGTQMCRVYIAAVFDSPMRPSPPAAGVDDVPAFCIPRLLRQMRSGVLNLIWVAADYRLKTLPEEERSEPAFMVVARALAEAYPCQGDHAQGR